MLGLIQVRVSAILTNAPFILNLDCDHYVNNSKAIREAMCFMMDPQLGPGLCYVQFPQRFDGIDRSDRYANRNTVFFDVSSIAWSFSGFCCQAGFFRMWWFLIMQVNMRGLDGIQGPVYVGTGTVFNRQALYGYSPASFSTVTKPSSSCSWCGCCSCCCPQKKPTKDLSELYKDTKREELDAAIFNLREIDSKSSVPITSI